MCFGLLTDTPEQHNDWPAEVSTTRRDIDKKAYGYFWPGALG
jgi:hypothetical protein